MKTIFNILLFKHSHAEEKIQKWLIKANISCSINKKVTSPKRIRERIISFPFNHMFML